jgi:pyrimidine-nucleoside phosphorylase
MVDLGRAAGLAVVAVLSGMDAPLGRSVGNLLEVHEAIETVGGTGSRELLELCVVLGSEVMVASNAALTLEEGRARLEATVANGSARAKLRDLVVSLGGDGAIVDEPSRLERAPHQFDVLAPRGATVGRIGARAIGEAAMHLGAGRATKSDAIDPVVGLVMHRGVGDTVQAGEAFATIHSRHPVGPTDAPVQAVLGAITWVDGPVARPPLVLEVVR